MTGERQRFTRSSLEAGGFQGWVTFAQLGAANVPATGGVYVVVREGGAAADYLDANPGGRFKGRDPTVSLDQLEANWVDGAEVVYFGKANDLHRRLREFMCFGEGIPIGHWGGRLIWQLTDSAELLVGWKETPGEVPKQVETNLIAEFRGAFGKPPFANEPHRLGG